MRRIPLSRRSHVTGFRPASTGCVEHESALERDFVTLTLFDDADAEITSQPVTIRFEHGGRARRYTPDFLVKSSRGTGILIEIKYRADLRAQWQRLRPAFCAARCWAAAHELRFRIVTESAVRVARLDAAKRLLALRSVPMDATLATTALATAADMVSPTFEALVGALPASREAALAVVWRLIARAQLRVDLTSPIGRDTRITPA